MGRQNDTTSPSASAPFVKGTDRVHSIPPRVRDVRTPLCVGRDSGSHASDLGQARRKIFLQKGLDRPFRKTRSDLPVGQFCRSNSVIARNDRHEAIHTCLAESRIASRSLSPLIGPRFPAGLLGRRQVERQWILIPPYGGSNPPAPARQLLDLRL